MFKLLEIQATDRQRKPFWTSWEACNDTGHVLRGEVFVEWSQLETLRSYCAAVHRSVDEWKLRGVDVQDLEPAEWLQQLADAIQPQKETQAGSVVETMSDWLDCAAGDSPGPGAMRPPAIAKLYDVTKPAVYYWIHHGQLEAIRHGGRWFVCPEALAAFEQSRPDLREQRGAAA